MNEISIKNFLNNLNRLVVEYGKNCNVKFISPTNTQLELYNIYTEHPDAYVLFEFKSKDQLTGPITINELIDKIKALDSEYNDTYIDFLNTKNQSIIFNNTSIRKGRNNTVIIQFQKWIPVKQEQNNYKNDEVARSLLGSIFR